MAAVCAFRFVLRRPRVDAMAATEEHRSINSTIIRPDMKNRSFRFLWIVTQER